MLLQIQVYAPTNNANSEDFYNQLKSVLEAVPEHELLIVMGDWNAKVGQAEEGEENHRQTSTKWRG